MQCIQSWTNPECAVSDFFRVLPTQFLRAGAGFVLVCVVSLLEIVNSILFMTTGNRLAKAVGWRAWFSPMKSLRLFCVAALSAVCLSGCLQIEKIVKLKPDGSGTIEETLTMSKETAAKLKEMAVNFGKAATSKKRGADSGLLNEKKLREEEENLGAGVKFVSAKKIDTEKSEGFTAIFSFTDINKLKLDQNPASALSAVGGAKAGPGQSKNEPLAFHFTKGSPAELDITMPQSNAAPKPQSDEAQAMAMQAMQQIFKDMKITIAVEFAGAITETNAQYHEGSRVTLMEMDFNKLLANPAKFKELAQGNPQSLQDSKALLKGLAGVKIESAPEVMVKFQ
jgi:hypothetical protein